MPTMLWVTIASFALAFAASRVLLAWFGQFALDRPNARSLHDRPVPRSGGIAVLLGASAAPALGAAELWLPFAIAVFGIYDASALFLIGLGAFYPVVVNTTHGVRDTNLLLLRAARMMGARPATVLAKVVFPSALPSIFTGLRLGIGVAWTAVIVAEMIAVKSGLGYVLWDAYYVGRMDICVATMFSVGLLGYVSDRVIVTASHLVLRWRTLEAHE